MARIPSAGTRNSGLQTRLAFFFTRRAMRDMTGRDPERALEPLEMYAHAPFLMNGYGKLEQATAKISDLDPRHRHLAELKAATMTHCEYCMDIGSQVARLSGLSDEELAALPDFRSSALFDSVDRLVLDYSVAMSNTPAHVPEELFAALREQFTDRQMIELTHVIALENHRGRFNLALGIGAAGFSEGMVCAVPATHALEGSGGH